MWIRRVSQRTRRPRQARLISLAAVGLLAVVLGLVQFVAGRIAAGRQGSEYVGVVTGKSVTVRQSKYGSRTDYWLEVRLASGGMVRVQVPEKLHHLTAVGSRFEKRPGDPLPKVTSARGGPAV